MIRRSAVLTIGLGTAILIALAAFFVIRLAQRPEAKRPPDRLLVNGQPYFWAGVNYPWKTYQDFGTGAWGHQGASDPRIYDEIDTDFANMAAQGVRIVKWRVFGDGRYSPEFDAQGSPTGLDEVFFADLDAALQIAASHDLYLVLSLFSSGLWTTNCQKEDVHFGYGPQVLADSARRQALLDKALVPLLRHVGANDRVLAYEIIAEPEWGIKELNKEKDYRAKVPLSAVRTFVRDAVAAIHRYTPALATLEANRPRNVKSWTGLGLDYYSFSWYDWMAPWDPLDVDVLTYGADRPLVLGEFPVNSGFFDVARVLDIAFGRGLAGAFPWSYTAGDRFSEWYGARPLYTQWLRDHWAATSLGGETRPLPADDPPVIAQPFDYSDVTLSAQGNAVSVSLDLLVRDGGSFVAKFFLYDDQGTPTVWQYEVPTAFNITRRKSLSADFPDLPSGRIYKLNFGVFDNADKLVKWFDGLAFFALNDGQLTLTSRTLEQTENPCAK